MTGAVISGWKAANAVTYALIEGEISRKGVSPYLKWWDEEVIQKYDYRDMVRNVILPLRLSPDEIDFVLGSVTKTLPSVLDPYETPKLVGGALAEVMPTIAKKRPTVFKKLSQMREVSLQSVFGGPIRGGFPMSMQS